MLELSPLPQIPLTSLMLIPVLTTLAPVIGCDSDGCPCCDLPRITLDWIIEIDTAPVPDRITEYPILIGVSVDVRSLEKRLSCAGWSDRRPESFARQLRRGRIGD
jgi:hypothetical protein